MLCHASYGSPGLVRAKQAGVNLKSFMRPGATCAHKHENKHSYMNVHVNTHSAYSHKHAHAYI